MKNILVFLFLFLSLKGFSQYPINQTIGSDSTKVESKGSLRSRLINIPFTDTTQANTQRIKFYDGAQIYTTSGGVKFWIRDGLLNKWTEVGKTYTGSTGITLVGNDFQLTDNYVPTSRTLTINGSTQDLSTNRTWNVGTVTLFGKTDSYGITSSVANSTTTPNHTVGVDSSCSTCPASKTYVGNAIAGISTVETDPLAILKSGTTFLTGNVMVTGDANTYNFKLDSLNVFLARTRGGSFGSGFFSNFGLSSGISSSSATQTSQLSVAPNNATFTLEPATVLASNLFFIGLKTGTAANVLYYDDSNGATTWGIAPSGSGGTVTDASVVSANGLAGTVANPTTTPAITLSTTVTGILKGNGTAISAASGSDIPNIAESQVTSLVSDLALKAPLVSPALTGTPTAPTASLGTNTTQIATTAFVLANAPAQVYPGAGIPLSTGSAWGTSITDNSTNWNTAYTNRITSLTTTGTSGAATLSSNTLNIPNYTYTLPAATTSTLGGVKVDGTSIVINGSNVISAAAAPWNGTYYATQENGLTSYTIPANTYEFNVFTGASNGVWTLPLISSSTNKTLFIKNATANTLTVQRQSTDNIYDNGSATSVVLAAGESRAFAVVGATYWYSYADGKPGGGTGTVTSVGLTSSDITVGGSSPITTSGTYTLTLPTVNSNVGTFGSASQTATFTANAKGQITAASQQSIAITESQVTNLVTDLSGKEPTVGFTTIGRNIATSTNPSAITFLRGNADNSVDWLSASAFRTAIGAGVGGGDMLLGTAQTVTAAKTFNDTKFLLRNVANTFNGSFVNTNTADRIYTLKDANGTIAFTSDITGTNSGTNTGDQTSIVGITGTKAQFNTAVTDGDILYVGDAVTTIGVTTANGVSGSSSGGTTPNLTISLGAITPTSVNSVVLSGSSTPTLAVTGTTTVSGANTGDQTTVSGNAGSATLTAITDDAATNATMYPTWVTTASGNQAQKISSTKLTFNPSTGALSSTSFTGAGTGLTGTASSLTAGNVTTNANLTGPVTSTGNATAIANGAITNAMLANSTITIGSTSTSLGGTSSTIAGLTLTAPVLGTPTSVTLNNTSDIIGGVTMTLGTDANYDVYYRNSSGVLTRLAAGTDGNVLTTHSTTSAPTWTAAGSGTVTAAGGSLTSNSVVLGAGTTDTKVVAGITTDGTSQLNLGVNTTTLGKVKMFGNTSGDATIQPAAVAGTATVITLPAVTSTLATLAGTETLTNKNFTSSTNTFPTTIETAKANTLNAYTALGSVVLGETVGVNVLTATVSNGLTSQTVIFQAVYLPIGATITGVKWNQATAGVYTSSNYNGVGLYTYSAGTLTKVASSTDDGTIWKGAAGIQSKAFSSTYVATAGLYFVGFVWSSSATTTAPALRGTAPPLGSFGLDFTNSGKLTGTLASQTSLPSPQASSGLTAPTASYYFALY